MKREKDKRDEKHFLLGGKKCERFRRLLHVFPSGGRFIIC